MKYDRMQNIVHWIPFVLSVFLFLNFNINGDFTATLLEMRYRDFIFDISFIFDVLSIMMLMMTTLIGGVVSQYALTSLAHEKNKKLFFINLYGSLLSVVLLVVSGNLILFVFFWLLAQFFSHKMMMFYNERLQARMACWKRNIVNVIGDSFIISSAIFLILNFKSLDFFTLVQMTQNSGFSNQDIMLPSVLMAIGIIIKTVQFPFHFWIVEAMEVPVVVSAVMHAGIINAGGFLLIRMSQIFPEALLMDMLLIYSGAISASFGAVSMIYQNDIKKKLAYSTVSQMGLMIYACGLGAYSIAMVHILVHSLYKSYTFLSIGGLVKEFRTAPTAIDKFLKNFILIFSFLYFVFLLYMGITGNMSAVFLYSYVISLGFFQSFFVNRKNYDISSYVVILAMISICFLFYLGIDSYITKHAKPFVSIETSAIISSYFHLVLPSFFIFFFSFFLCVFQSNKNSCFSKKMKFFFLNGAYLKNISTRFFLKNSQNEVPYV